MFASLRHNHQLLLQSRAGAETLPSPPQPSQREAVRVTSLGRRMHTLANGQEAGTVEEAAVAFEESERWLHIDDDLVESAKPEDVVTDGAYVLFYRRRRLSGRLVVGNTAVAPVV